MEQKNQREQLVQAYLQKCAEYGDLALQVQQMSQKCQQLMQDIEGARQKLADFDSAKQTTESLSQLKVAEIPSESEAKSA